MIRIEPLHTYWGPNPYASEAVVLHAIELTELGEQLALGLASALGQAYPHWVAANNKNANNVQQLLQALADCSRGLLNDVRGCIRTAGASTTPEGHRIWLGFHAPDLTQRALQWAAMAALVHINPTADSLEKLNAARQALGRRCRAQHPDYQAKFLMDAAHARNVPFLPMLPSRRYWQFGWGSRSRVFFESAPEDNGFLGGMVAQSKVATKEWLASLGMPVAPHRLVQTADELPAALAVVGWPCVVKPVDQGKGRGVTADIRDLAAAQRAFDWARQYSRGPIMVEAFVPGDDHRLTVVNGSVVAVTRREPPVVTGDGVNTIEVLVNRLNEERKSLDAATAHLSPIALDEGALAHLAAQGLVPATVLALGQRVAVRSNGNISTGGVAVDATATVHPQVAAMAEAIAAATSQSVLGVDYITTDIGLPPSVSGGQFVEINSVPGIDVAFAGGVAPEALANALLGEVPGRIPVRLTVVGSLSPDEVAHWVGHCQDQEGTGWMVLDRIGVGSMQLQTTADTVSWARLGPVLRNKAVVRLELVVTADELMTKGMPLDQVDRVVLLTDQVPETWLAVLEKHSTRIESKTDTEI